MSTFTPTLPSAPVSNRNISFILLRQMPVRNIYHGAIVSLNWDKINWVGSSCAFKMHLFTKKTECNDEYSLLSVWVQFQIFQQSLHVGVSGAREVSEPECSAEVGVGKLGGEIISSQVELFLSFDYRWQSVINYFASKTVELCEITEPFSSLHQVSVALSI